MSEHRVTVSWKRASEGFKYEEYNREHAWAFDAGIQVRASAAPDFRGKPDCVDPEEALIAALSSCHMLTFLAIASRKRLVVDSYEDAAVGILEKNAAGRLAVTR
ncbi:OsmC family peroxiredoxin, partial [bacterium]